MKRIVYSVAILLLVPMALLAQDPVAILEYFDNPDGITVTSAEGEDLFPEYGMELLPGDKIKTTTSTAELRAG